jgi:hypothetical protein
MGTCSSLTNSIMKRARKQIVNPVPKTRPGNRAMLVFGKIAEAGGMNLSPSG